jgi:RHS repeat-associated protein
MHLAAARGGIIDGADNADLLAYSNSTPTDPLCIYTHDRNGDRRVDHQDEATYLAYADSNGVDNGNPNAPELAEYGKPLRLEYDMDGDGRVDMFDWYAMQCCFTKSDTRCLHVFDVDASNLIDLADLPSFRTAAEGGPTTSEWHSTLVASRYGNPFMWTGQRYDATTGQYHFWARTYSPMLGQWLQRDPLGYFDSPNSYLLTFANPIEFRDAWGLASKKEVVDELWNIIRKQELELLREKEKLEAEIEKLSEVVNLVHGYDSEARRKLRQIEAELLKLSDVYLDGTLATIVGIGGLTTEGALAKGLGVLSILVTAKTVQDWRMHIEQLEIYMDFLQAALEAWITQLKNQMDYIYKH